MTEKLLQYLWNFKIFNRFDFKDTQGRELEILNYGSWNSQAGPDFLLAKIKVDNLILAGHIELHLRSSDWEAHQHSKDIAYDNVILHAVYEHDKEIDFLREKNISTLQLKEYINPSVLEKYNEICVPQDFIPCEKIIDADKIPVNFSEETVLNKLDEKSNELEAQLHQYKNNYEAVLFHRLAYAFGLKVNAEIFQLLAQSIDFGVVQKIRQNREQLEALLLGKAGWLSQPFDVQMKRWSQEYDYVKSKFSCSDLEFNPKFLRLRPQNFPTLRLSQLAHLYHKEVHLFSRLMDAKNLHEMMEVFAGVQASSYWDSRYNFGAESEMVYPKILSSDFIYRIIINAVLPLRYAYYKQVKEEIADEILEFYSALPAEKNHILKKWENLGLKMNSALQSQSFLYQYKNFCLSKNCLNCSIAFQFLKGE